MVQAIGIGLSFMLSLLTTMLAAAVFADEPEPSETGTGDICHSAQQVPAPDALIALREVLPELIRLHPGGHVSSLATFRSPSQSGSTEIEPFRRWSLYAWAPERGQLLHYQADGSQLLRTGTIVTTGDGQPIRGVRVAHLDGDGSIADVIDSARIAGVADRIGAQAYCEQTGSYIRSMQLVSGRHRRLVWLLFYSGGLNGGRLSLDFDARTGALLEYRNPDGLFLPSSNQDGDATSPEASYGR